MRGWLKCMALAACVGTLPGCWWAKGGSVQKDMQSQRSWATLHDPYPSNDIGPAVDGGRPPGFEKQQPEPVRSRYLRDWWWFGGK
ncbi:MAG: hypothetical protein CMJ59_12270 [Planctomycetaceae bacterium]|nr:hypothetical protein [Planctomycetaceae bacterium]